MILKSELAIIAPAYYPGNAQIQYYLDSAARHGIAPLLYGRGKPYTGWMQIQITGCLEALDALASKYRYVLYTDASDVIFLKDKVEIIRRYCQLGHPPMLISEEDDGLNAGGWIGELDVAATILTHLRDMNYCASGNPQVRWREALSMGKVWAMRDYGRVVFSVNQFPTDACILHLAGGYSDPETGRAEKIAPIWKELGW